MIQYEESILKGVEKGRIPERVFLQIHHCFEAIQKVGDMTIFDVKQVKHGSRRINYRLRKSRFRTLFFFEPGRIKVIAMEHRMEVHRKWR